MLSIQSFSDVYVPGQANFMVEVQSGSEAGSVSIAVAEIEDCAAFVKVLGSYSSYE